MKNSKLLCKLVLVAVFCIFLNPFAFSVEKVELRFSKDVLTQVQTIRTLQVVPSAVALQQALRLGQDTTLQLLKQDAERGVTYSRYIMLFRGIPVWGEQIAITENQNGIVRMHGNAITCIEQDVKSVTPAFDAKTALELMKNQKTRSVATTKAWNYENEASDLVIFVNKDKAQLCYAVTFFADVEGGGNPTRPIFMVDANTKEVVWNIEGLTTEEMAGGTGPGGNTKTGAYRYGAEYPAFEVTYANGKSTMKNTNVITVNLNHGTSGSTPYTYDGTENKVKEINGAYSPLNDGHFFGGVVFNVYKEWYNTAPLTFALTMKIHYSKNYENAFWNGSSMTFGDGATRFYPLVSLDVSAHEVSHGFTEQNSGLIYSAQSGGINESFSDMAGEASEYFMKNKNDWMVGAEIFKSTGALRYLDDPTKDKKSIGSAKNYTNGMDVHYSSGVFNKAFYLLAVTPGWNTRKAFDVFVKANQKFWTPSATFVTGAQGVVDAAKDLGYSTQDVVKAFKGVDVEVTAD